jgi:hypothetical protein
MSEKTQKETREIVEENNTNIEKDNGGNSLFKEFIALLKDLIVII